jgi:hypothetical protein
LHQPDVVPGFCFSLLLKRMKKENKTWYVKTLRSLGSARPWLCLWSAPRPCPRSFFPTRSSPSQPAPHSQTLPPTFISRGRGGGSAFLRTVHAPSSQTTAGSVILALANQSTLHLPTRRLLLPRATESAPPHLRRLLFLPRATARHRRLLPSVIRDALHPHSTDTPPPRVLAAGADGSDSTRNLQRTRHTS